MAEVALPLKRKTTGPREGGAGFPPPVEDGKYRATLRSPEVVNDRYGGLKMNVEITQGDYSGRILKSMRVFFPGEAARSLVEVLGGDSDDEEAKIDLEEVDGLEVNVYLGSRKSKTGPGTFNTIKRFSLVPKR